MIDERAQVATTAVAPTRGLSIDGALSFIRIDRTRGIALANLGLAAGLILNGLMGLLVFNDPIGVVLSTIPFVGFFYIMARLLSLGDEPSARVLRISGFAALLLVPMSVASIFDSLKAPVDVGCIFASTGFSAAFLWAGIYQLRAAAPSVSKKSLRRACNAALLADDASSPLLMLN